MWADVYIDGKKSSFGVVLPNSTLEVKGFKTTGREISETQFLFTMPRRLHRNESEEVVLSDQERARTRRAGARLLIGPERCARCGPSLQPAPAACRNAGGADGGAGDHTSGFLHHGAGPLGGRLLRRRAARSTDAPCQRSAGRASCHLLRRRGRPLPAPGSRLSTSAPAVAEGRATDFDAVNKAVAKSVKAAATCAAGRAVNAGATAGTKQMDFYKNGPKMGSVTVRYSIRQKARAPRRSPRCWQHLDEAARFHRGGGGALRFASRAPSAPSWSCWVFCSLRAARGVRGRRAQGATSAALRARAAAAARRRARRSSAWAETTTTT